jgi:hypothetical protein
VERVEIGLKVAFEAKKLHVNFVIKLESIKKGGIVQILTKTQKDKKLREEVTERK